MSRKEYISQYSNSTSETLWTFKFDYKNKIGMITYDWARAYYPVYEGKNLFPRLPQEINDWLCKQWDIATKGTKDLDIYLGHKIEIKTNKRETWLTEAFCPICLETKSIFDSHHCVARCEGGLDGYANVLRICATCHAIITRGCFEDRWSRDNAALFHQVMYFGYDVFPRAFNKPVSQTHPDGYISATKFEADLSDYDRQDGSNKQELQIEARNEGRFLYQFYRDICLGKWLWKDALRVFPDLYSAFRKKFEWVKL